MKPRKISVYLDHGVLDKMTKGELHEVKGFISKDYVTPLFSDENLNEISKSKGYENTFLNLLQDINAKHINSTMTHDFQYTGMADIQDINPFDAYSSYKENRMDMPDHGYGLSGMLHKFYGGHRDKTFTEIFTSGMSDLFQLAETEVTNLKDSDDLSVNQKQFIDNTFSEIKQYLPDTFSTLGDMLELDNDKSHVKQVEEAFSVGPLRLNNLEGPNILNQIWEKISNNVPNDSMDIDTFFGLNPSVYGNMKKNELTLIEKVNAIYHQLNFVGYHRDEAMNKQNKFKASFSDMTHAGVAIFADLFICRDRRLVMKTAAACD